MGPCDLDPESVSLLVKQHLLPNSEGEGWRASWGSECALQEGMTLRIPYDPDEINATAVTPVGPDGVGPEDSVEINDSVVVAEGGDGGGPPLSEKGISTPREDWIASVLQLS